MNPRESPERYVMDTASGARLDLDGPRHESIRIEDVAGGLSRVCRMGAQALEFFSVAQHALLVCDLVCEGGRRDLALPALHHDSHEAYLCDLPKPLKRKISSHTSVYEQTCDAVDLAIAAAFGFDWPERGSPDSGLIKDADRRALATEARSLLPNGGRALRRDHGLTGGPAALPEPLPPVEAEIAFLDRHRELVRA